MNNSPHDPTGNELANQIARSVLANAAAKKFSTKKSPKVVNPKVSGAFPDARDPQTLKDTVAGLVAQQGWETEINENLVVSSWPNLVGPEIARHTTCEKFDLETKKLYVRTDSTAWATQLKLLTPELLKLLNRELPDGSVKIIEVLGPQAPNWSKGKFRVKGVGPRDTYR